MMMMMMKMWVLPLLVGLCFQSGSPSPVAPLTCQTPEILRVADLALRKINTDRQEGYIFSFNRVYDFKREVKDNGALVYSLVIDVRETQCHVISRKNYSDCWMRMLADGLKYGHCDTVISVNSSGENIELHNYTCTIEEVPMSAIFCFDCTSSWSVNNLLARHTAEVSLEKFNKENGLTNYFALLQVTNVRSQFLAGLILSVEFTIQETVCSKETPAANVSECSLMDCEFAHKGFCTATSWPYSESPEIPATQQSIGPAWCEIFEPKGKKPKEAKNEEEQGPDADKQHEHANQTHKHDHKHLHHHQASNAACSPPERRAPVGTVQELPQRYSVGPSRAPPSASGCPGNSSDPYRLGDLEI
ncbi:hypothetical protein GJAV_G00086210 [Gymnothorax javanicus]|nr:hypothetical protein GJAV_G00086210 [Gymnothorax javanicus]